MLINYDIRKLDRALEDFYNVTGVSICILSEDFSPIDSKRSSNMYCRLIQSKKCGRISCFEFNRHILEKCKETKEPIIRICHAGLVEIAVPLIHYDSIVGYAVLGHIRGEGGAPDFDAMSERLGVGSADLAGLFSSLEAYTSKRLESIMNMAQMFCRCLLLDNLIRPKENEYFVRIKKYVEDNVFKKLTPQMISSATFLSKSTMYLTVNSQLGCSVSEYIYRVKIEKAKELLKKTDLTVREISETLGFSGPSYLAKKFKEISGISPVQFRKDNSL